MRLIEAGELLTRSALCKHLLVACLVLIYSSTELQAQRRGGGAGAGPIGPSIFFGLIEADVSATKEVPVENRPLYVHFDVMGGTISSAPKGFVEVSVTSEAGNVATGPYQWRTPALQPAEMFSGVLVVTAPRAGSGNVIRLVWNKEVSCGGGEIFGLCGTEITHVEQPLTTGAEMSFRLSQLHAYRSRKQIQANPLFVPWPVIIVKTDDVWASLGASLSDGTSIMDPTTVHVGLVREGNDQWITGDGPQRHMDSLETPRFGVIPGRPQSLKVAYSVNNINPTGHDSQQFFDKVSDATAGVLKGIYPTADWQPVNELTKTLNQWTFDSCVGVLATEAISFATNELLDLTDESNLERRVRFNGTDYGVPWNCGGGNSDYEVQWNVERWSGTLHPINDYLEVSPRIWQMRRGEVLNLTVVFSGTNTPVDPVNWSVEGGAGRGTVSSDGLFSPSATAKEGDIMVIRANEPGGRRGSGFVGIVR